MSRETCHSEPRAIAGDLACSGVEALETLLDFATITSGRATIAGTPAEGAAPGSPSRSPSPASDGVDVSSGASVSVVLALPRRRRRPWFRAMVDASRAIDVCTLLEHSDELVRRTVTGRGHLRRRGGGVGNAWPVLEDTHGRRLRVTPWLPMGDLSPRLAGPGGRHPRGLRDFFDHDILLTGVLERDAAGELVLVAKRAQVISEPHQRRLDAEQLAAVAGVGGEGVVGYGALAGELIIDGGDQLRLVTADRGGPCEVSFTLDVLRRDDLLFDSPIHVHGLIRKATPWLGAIRRAAVAPRIL